MIEYGTYTTKVKDNKGRVYDLGKGEHLPDEENVWAVNAWTELIEGLDLPDIITESPCRIDSNAENADVITFRELRAF